MMCRNLRDSVTTSTACHLDNRSHAWIALPAARWPAHLANADMLRGHAADFGISLHTPRVTIAGLTMYCAYQRSSCQENALPQLTRGVGV